MVMNSRVKWYVTGMAVGVMLAACAGISFPYHYYGLSAATYANGKLVGPTPADDLDLMQCQPSTQNARPCLVMVSTDFLAMKQDYVDTKNQLIACQKAAK